MLIPPAFQFGSITFNTYGLIVGAAILFASSLIERKYKKLGYSEDSYYKIGILVLVSSIVFARIWHIFTDFYLYQNNLIEALYVWNGGLSIFGGILGGFFALVAAVRLFKEFQHIKVLKLLDIAVFGLPIGQSVGRLANYVIQELYGLPSNGFLKIFIDKEHRLPGYEDKMYYHPLFLYEMILMLLFGLAVYFFEKQKRLPKVGSGKLFAIYVLYYSIVRFFLDFIRIDKTVVEPFGVGVNQLVLLGVIILTVIFIRKKNVKKNS